MTCVCKNILCVKHLLLERPITIEFFVVVVVVVFNILSVKHILLELPYCLEGGMRAKIIKSLKHFVSP